MVNNNAFYKKVLFGILSQIKKKKEEIEQSEHTGRIDMYDSSGINMNGMLGVRDDVNLNATQVVEILIALEQLNTAASGNEIDATPVRQAIINILKFYKKSFYEYKNDKTRFLEDLLVAEIEAGGHLALDEFFLHEENKFSDSRVASDVLYAAIRSGRTDVVQKMLQRKDLDFLEFIADLLTSDDPNRVEIASLVVKELRQYHSTRTVSNYLEQQLSDMVQVVWDEIIFLSEENELSEEEGHALAKKLDDISAFAKKNGLQDPVELVEEALPVAPQEPKKKRLLFKGLFKGSLFKSFFRKSQSPEEVSSDKKDAEKQKELLQSNPLDVEVKAFEKPKNNDTLPIAAGVPVATVDKAGNVVEIDKQSLLPTASAAEDGKFSTEEQSSANDNIMTEDERADYQSRLSHDNFRGLDTGLVLDAIQNSRRLINANDRADFITELEDYAQEMQESGLDGIEARMALITVVCVKIDHEEPDRRAVIDSAKQKSTTRRLEESLSTFGHKTPDNTPDGNGDKEDKKIGV